MAVYGHTRAFEIARARTGEAVKHALVETAKREHEIVLTTDPRPQGFTRLVDGKPGLREEDARTFGIIQYFYPRLEEVVADAFTLLIRGSPVDSGDYRAAHQLFVNSAPVPSLKDWKMGDEISISNPLPYSRKIEVGAMTMRVPGTDHVYEQATRKLKRKWGKVAQIRFTFRGVASPFGYGKNRETRDSRTPVLLIGPL